MSNSPPSSSPAPHLQTFRARYLFTAAGEAIPDGVLAVKNGQVVWAGKPSASGPTPEDQGDVAILPKFVNAHTHLEFSDLSQPIAASSDPNDFPAWIENVVAHRRRRAETLADPAAAKQAAILAGWRECQDGGARGVGEIATAPWPPPSESVEAAPMRAFLELLSLAPERIDAVEDAARSHLSQSGGRWRPGLSPHAPYTVHPDLLERAVRLSAETKTPLAMHLAESRQELELLKTGGGAMKTMLQNLGAWPQDASFFGGIRPLDYLRVLSQAHQALVVHGNYLQADEIEFLAKHRQKMTVVYCPRTHAFFQHARYPLAELRAAGVSLALGTDSRASNPSLSMWEEACFAAQKHSELPPRTILQMAIGDLSEFPPNRLSDWMMVQLPSSVQGDPYELLWNSHSPRIRDDWRRGDSL